MAIDRRQIADITDIAQPQFVMDPLVGGTTPGITMTKKSDGKYHITLTLLQSVIDGTASTPVPSDTTVSVDPNSLSLRYDPIFYDGNSHTISESNVTGFDSNIMRLGGDTNKTDAGTYTVKVYLKDTANYKWSDSRAATASVDFTWNITRVNMSSWSISPTSLTISGTPGSTGSITVTRTGNGAVTATSNNTSAASVTVTDATGTSPKVTVTDKTGGGTGSAVVTVAVGQGTNHNSSAVSHESVSDCPASITCQVSLSTATKELKDYTPEEIVAIVRRGDAKKYFKVGDRIPITINDFTISKTVSSTNYLNGTTYSDTVSNGTFDAVVIGFDHNIENETPSVSHSMSFAVMYFHNSDQAMCFYPIVHISYFIPMYDSLQPVYNAMPSSWQNIIVSTNKTISNRRRTGEAFAVDYYPATINSKIFHLSHYEVYGETNILSHEIEFENGKQVQYEYFKNNSFPVSVKKHDEPNGNDLIIISRSLYDDKPYTTNTNNVENTSGIMQFYMLLSDCFKNRQYTYPNTTKTATAEYYANVVSTSDLNLSIPSRFSSVGNVGQLMQGYKTVGFIPCFTIG